MENFKIIWLKSFPIAFTVLFTIVVLPFSCWKVKNCCYFSRVFPTKTFFFWASLQYRVYSLISDIFAVTTTFSLIRYSCKQVSSLFSTFSPVKILLQIQTFFDITVSQLHNGNNFSSFSIECCRFENINICKRQQKPNEIVG